MAIVKYVDLTSELEEEIVEQVNEEMLEALYLCDESGLINIQMVID